jgi:hypothetical protein
MTCTGYVQDRVYLRKKSIGPIRSGCTPQPNERRPQTSTCAPPHVPCKLAPAECGSSTPLLSLRVLMFCALGFRFFFAPRGELL